MTADLTPGPIDEFYDYRFGRLPYDHWLPLRDARSGTLPAGGCRELSVRRGGAYADHRVQAFDRAKARQDQHHLRIPCGGRRPLLPGAAAENAALFRKYQALADATPHVTFVGRLASYRYYNMDQVVAQALSAYARMLRAPGRARSRRRTEDRARSRRRLAWRCRRSLALPSGHALGSCLCKVCSTAIFSAGSSVPAHRRHDGRRLDLIAATGHDRAVVQDYTGDARPWHSYRSRRGPLASDRDRAGPLRLVEFLAHAARLQRRRSAGHLGPLPLRLARSSGHLAAQLRRPLRQICRGLRDFGAADETDRVPFWCPVNGISYWAWAGAPSHGSTRSHVAAARTQAPARPRLDRGHRGDLGVDRRARIVQVDPVINVVPRSSRPQSVRAAEAHRLAQFEAWDMRRAG